jgi:hypothetical protein
MDVYLQQQRILVHHDRGVYGTAGRALVARPCIHDKGHGDPHLRSLRKADMILALVKEHGPVNRGQVNEMLLPKLPDRLSTTQRRGAG